MSPETLESRLGRWATPIEMLRNSPSRRFRFPYPDQYTTWQDEQAAGWINEAMPDITFGAVSQHLKVLSDAKLVVVRRDGRRRLYRADRVALGPLGEQLMALWGQQLTTLKRLAADEWNAKKRR